MAQVDGTIAIREGTFTAMQYTSELLKFIYVRTGFRSENFTTPRALQRLLNDASFNRIPMSIWHGLMNAALRIVRVCETVQQGAHAFMGLFIEVVVWISERLVRMGIIEFSIFLVNYCVNPLVKSVVVMITLAITKLLQPLAVEFTRYIRSRYFSAPNRHDFMVMY